MIHLLAVFFLVVAPIVEVVTGALPVPSPADFGEQASAGPAKKSAISNEFFYDEGGKPWKLTWVKAPVTIQGWQETPEGRPEGTVRHEIGDGARVDEPGTSFIPYRPGQPDQGVRFGQQGSYDQYLSYQIRRAGHDQEFFRQVRPDVWAVIHYRISGDGQLLDSELIKCNTTPADGMRAVEVLRMSAPFERLPEGAHEIDVTELFWNQAGARFVPGTLEERLSHLPDGRLIRIK